MRQITFLAIITLFFNSVFCQETVQLAHAFEPGRTYKFEVKRGKEDSDNPGSGRIFVVTSIEATVEKQNDSCLITLNYGESRIEGVQLPPEAQEQFRKQELYYGLSIVISVNDQGSLTELVNYQEIRDQLESKMADVANENNIDDHTLELIKRNIGFTLDTPENLLGTYFPEISGYFNLLGSTFMDGESQEFEVILPNPINSKNIPTTIELELKELDNEVLFISGNQTFDPDDFKEIIMSLLQSLEVPLDEQIPTFEATNMFFAKYDKANKVLMSVTEHRRIRSDGLFRNNYTNFELIE